MSEPVPTVPVDQPPVFYHDGEEYVAPTGFRYRQVYGRWVLVARPEPPQSAGPE